MWFSCKVLITQAWCWCTRAHAVYVKDLNDGHIMVKVMRTRFDPFVDQPQRQVFILNHGYRQCHDTGEVSYGWQWRYVNNDAHVQHILRMADPAPAHPGHTITRSGKVNV